MRRNSTFRNAVRMIHENNRNRYSSYADEHFQPPLAEVFAILCTALLATGAPPVCWIATIGGYLLLEIFAEGGMYANEVSSS